MNSKKPKYTIGETWGTGKTKHGPSGADPRIDGDYIPGIHFKVYVEVAQAAFKISAKWKTPLKDVLAVMESMSQEEIRNSVGDEPVTMRALRKAKAKKAK